MRSTGKVACGDVAKARGDSEGQPCPCSGELGAGSGLGRAPVSPCGSGHDVCAGPWGDAGSSPSAGALGAVLAPSPRQAGGPRAVAALGDAQRLPGGAGSVLAEADIAGAGRGGGGAATERCGGRGWEGTREAGSGNGVEVVP